MTVKYTILRHRGDIEYKLGNKLSWESIGPVERRRQIIDSGRTSDLEM